MFLIIKRYVVVLLNKNSSKEYVFIRIHVFYRTLYVLLFKLQVLMSMHVTS